MMFFKWADERGITLTAIAEKTGYTRSYVSQVRNGKLPISRSFAARVRLAFPVFFESRNSRD